MAAISDYSTSEQDTGFTWVDGKTIYRKTFSLGYLPNNSGLHINHGISQLGKVIKIEGTAQTDNLAAIVPIPYINLGKNLMMVLCTDTQIQITTQMNMSAYSGYVTLYYTKTS